MGDHFEGFMQLPIRRRGHFLKDDFFKGFQQDFDFAIRDVMDRHLGKSLLADQFSNYRKMRENTEETGPAASISETEEATIIVLDMSDFVKGSISVRTKGRYAVVEANFNTKTFHRKFLLHRTTNIDGVKSALSNEGILTITAPKRGSQMQPSNPSNGQRQDPACLKIDVGEPDEDDTDKTSPSSPNPEEKLPTAENSDKHESDDPPSTSGEERRLSISKKGGFFEDQYFKNVWKDFEKAMEEMVHREEKKKTVSDEKRQEEMEIASRLKNEMLFDAERKQQEFFDKAIASSVRVPKYSRLNSYNNLRSWAPDTDTQATTVTQDGNGYKIVMDMKGCSNAEGDLSIKATEGSITVCGKRGDLSFKREFTLKGLSNPDQVNASLSEDGILTITVS